MDHLGEYDCREERSSDDGFACARFCLENMLNDAEPRIDDSITSKTG